jgi:glutamyl-Q tRNA(Asp) synthetase
MTSQYRGRFAPSPTGPLHAGSLAAALGSWLDARAYRGRWLLRIEDIDPPREVAGAAAGFGSDLHACGMHADDAPVFQSRRTGAYAAALARLDRAGLLFGCRCSRSRIEEDGQRAGLPPGVYPGTCRGRPVTAGCATRVRVPSAPIRVQDRRLGTLVQALEREVGDFVVRRADGLWTYQLAVVVDDGAAGITDVVRGADLADNTPRQVFLQHALGLPTPRYLHLPLVLGEDGRKLSKQSGARAIDPREPAAELAQAWMHLGFAPLPPRLHRRDPEAFLRDALEHWRRRWAA